MLKENQKAILRWNSRNKQYYVDKGYKYTQMQDKFEVDINDLTPSSKAKVVVICDYCGKEVVKAYQTYVKQHHKQFGDACIQCQPLKSQLVCLEKYGVDNGSKTMEAIQKIKDTCMERYGVDNGSKTPIAIQKIKKRLKNNADERIAKTKQTNLERYGDECVFRSPIIKKRIRQSMINNYGVPYPKQSAEIKAKERQHNMAKYGYEHVMQVPEIKAKAQATTMKHYGVPYSLQSEQVRAKGRQTLQNNGNVPTSQQQLKLYKMLSLLYDDCILNYSYSKCSLDCLLTINDCKIDVEYDGWYWHKDKQDADRRRDEFMKLNGFKILRIKGNRQIPTIQQLQNAIDYLVKGNHSYTEIILDI